MSKVYEAWHAVSEDMARGGIAKNRQASMGGAGNYRFRGIDDVLHALSGSMATRKLGVGVSFADPVVTLRDKGNGKSERHVVMRATFSLFSLEDGSSAGPFAFVGEASDSGDKATNKAMSIAYKYFAIQTFAIPTEGVLADEEPNEPDEAPRERKPEAVTHLPNGTAIKDATDAELVGTRESALKALANPARKEVHPRAQATVVAIGVELERREGVTP